MGRASDCPAFRCNLSGSDRYLDEFPSNPAGHQAYVQETQGETGVIENKHSPATLKYKIQEASIEKKGMQV